MVNKNFLSIVFFALNMMIYFIIFDLTSKKFGQIQQYFLIIWIIVSSICIVFFVANRNLTNSIIINIIISFCGVIFPMFLYFGAIVILSQLIENRDYESIIFMKYIFVICSIINITISSVFSLLWKYLFSC